MPPLSDEHEPDPYFDPAEFFCQNGDYLSAARHLSEGDIYRKAILGLDTQAAAELGRHLAPRGLELQDDDTHWVITARDTHAASGDDPPPPSDDQPGGGVAPAPDREIEEVTGEQCRFGAHPVKGPPEPFCCAQRRWLILKMQAAQPPGHTVQRGGQCVCAHRAGDHDARGFCTYRDFGGHTCPCATYTPAPAPAKDGR